LSLALSFCVSAFFVFFFHQQSYLWKESSQDRLQKTISTILEMSDSIDGEIKFVFYHYTPSIAAAIIFVVLFGLGFAGHVYYIFKLRARYFIAFTIGVLRKSLELVSVNAS
jgi:hypothetical protein